MASSWGMVWSLCLETRGGEVWLVGGVVCLNISVRSDKLGMMELMLAAV